MENLVMFRGTYTNKTAWISGHTGFKGSWLCHWLLGLGAKVHGFSLPPPTTPSLFTQLKLQERLHHAQGDVRDADAVRRSLQSVQPDFVFHLAAQPIVRAAYKDPVETYASNVMGTIHVLDALRFLNNPCAAVFVTTDKCYENREWHYGYREEDPLGGHDPYSSSKAAAEVAIQSFRRSFFHDHPVKIASVRAGNVIGGGDWAIDRIMPDCIRALEQGKPIYVRNKTATRPWQHVMEPLSGYLWLAALLSRPDLRPSESRLLCSAFNFGPTSEANRSVAKVVEAVLDHWPGEWVDKSDPNAVHEANSLHLVIDKARELLGWTPVLKFSETIAQTVKWYRFAKECNELYAISEFTSQQIADYARHAKNAALPWAAA